VLTDSTGLQAATNPNPRPLTPEEREANRQAVVQANQASGSNFTPGDLGRVRGAIDNALRMVAAPRQEGAVNPCREALVTNFGVADPTAAIEALRPTGGAYVQDDAGQAIQGTQNVFDGRVSQDPVGGAGDQTTVVDYLNAHPTVNAITNRTAGNIYIDDSFHSRSEVQRAQDVIHEAVVHRSGNRDDASFASQEERDRQVRGETEAQRAERVRRAGSQRINEIIRTNCPTIPRQN